MPDASVKVGFIGLGNMGEPMARRVHDTGFLCAVHDARPELTERLAGELGLQVWPTLGDIGANCDVVILMLPNGKVVREVVLGGPGKADCLTARSGQGLIIIDMSSSAPMGTRELGQSLAAKGIKLLDAPVSGGVKKAWSGELSIMAGGDGELLAQWRWLLEAMGKRVFATGPLGSGHAVKALNNFSSAAGLAAASEALRVAQAFGIDGQALTDILNASTGRNNATENKFKQFILSGTYASGFSLDLMAKDLATAYELAEQTDTDAPFLRCCSELWREASEQLGAGADHTEYIRFFRHQS